MPKTTGTSVVGDPLEAERAKLGQERSQLADQRAQLQAREAHVAQREADAQRQFADINELVQQEVNVRLGKVPEKPREIRHLELMCPAFGPTDGYGNSAEQMALALERAGITVSLAGTPIRCGALNAEHIFTRPPTRGDAILFYSQPPGWIQQRDRKAFGFSMFEADDIPASWFQGLVRVDEVWVPSAHNAEIFRRRMPERREVHVIPLAVDAAAFAAKRRERGEKLRFIHSATYASEVRKGADLAIEAFRLAFAGREDVELIVRSTFGSDLDRVHQFADGDARIQFVTGKLTTAELAELLHGFDAMIYPSRGEGFGLIPMEAMASGMPAIFPRSTGMLEYADLGLPVDVRAVPSRIGSGRVGASPWALDANWYEPSLEELVARLREIDGDYDVVQDRAMLDAERIRAEWTWDRTAAAIKERLAS